MSVINIKIKQLITINGCSATNNKIIDAELWSSVGSPDIIVFNDPNEQLKFLGNPSMQPMKADGEYSYNGVDYKFIGKKVWLSLTGKTLSIEI